MSLVEFIRVINAVRRVCVVATNSARAFLSSHSPPSLSRTRAHTHAPTTRSDYVNKGDLVHESHTVTGECVFSTWLSNGTNTLSGTSMATPHVAAAVALCFGNVATGAGPCASLTPSQIVAKFMADAAANGAAGRGFQGDKTSGRNYSLHYGDLIDVAAF